MKLENQLCSLKLAKRLKELGVKQESYWMWIKYKFWKEPSLWENDMSSKIKLTCLSGKREYNYSAFTVAELGEMLPYQVSGRIISFHKFPKGYTIQYNPVAKKAIKEGKYWADGNTEANARAKMLIYILENKLINLPK